MAGHRLFISLPHEVLYTILRFAANATSTVDVLCNILAPLSKTIHADLKNNGNELWEIILWEYSPRGAANISRVEVASYRAVRKRRRQSKRLRPTTAKDDVAHAHLSLRDRTESAVLALSEMACDRTAPLSLGRLRGVFREFGPVLRVDQRARIGGTLLVECCRARFVVEGVVLRCVRALVEEYGADPNVPAAEGHTGFVGAPLPPLVVVAARGMSRVVKFLVGAGADIAQVGTTRFRLYTNPRKSVRGTHTPLQFALAMRDAEIQHGAKTSELISLNRCIHILTDASELIDSFHQSGN